MAQRSRLISLLLLLVVLAIAGARYLQSRPVAPKAVVVERQVSGATNGVAPAPEFLLRHAQQLALSSTQRRQIAQLASAYRRDITPAEQKLAQEGRHYGTSLARPPRGSRPTPQELSDAAEEYRRLSAVVSTTRHSYWVQARGLLSSAQRRTADALARTASLSDLT